jgi:hypothetical protein
MYPPTNEGHGDDMTPTKEQGAPAFKMGCKHRRVVAGFVCEDCNAYFKDLDAWRAYNDLQEDR